MRRRKGKVFSGLGLISLIGEFYRVGVAGAGVVAFGVDDGEVGVDPVEGVGIGDLAGFLNGGEGSFVALHVELWRIDAIDVVGGDVWIILAALVHQRDDDTVVAEGGLVVDNHARLLHLDRAFILSMPLLEVVDVEGYPINFDFLVDQVAAL